MLAFIFGIILTALPGSCQYNGALPDARCTPGAVRTADADVVCHQTTRELRVDLSTVKHERMQAYGVQDQSTQDFELDHLISLELGGSNDVTNLWPEPYTGEWNAHQKDRLENRLHRLVCSGEIPLGDAQQLIATDWVSAYERYISN